MKIGTDWENPSAAYSRFTYDETKRYCMLLKEQGVSVLDDEFNFLQETLLTFLRRFVWDSFGNGSATDAFQISVPVDGSDNDFTINGGSGPDVYKRIWVNGYCVLITAATTYSGQNGQGGHNPITLPNLTTPTGPRTDEVYIDVYLDEVAQDQDSTIVDPTLDVETSRRLKLYWAVRVAEGDVTPASYIDSFNRDHWTYHIATLARTAQAEIDPDMITDTRQTFGTLWARVAGDSAQTFEVANADEDSQAINRGQANAQYAQLAVANTFTAEQTMPDLKLTDNSDPRRKENVQPYALDWTALKRIGAKHWDWKGTQEHGSGTLAPDVAEVLPEHAHFDAHGRPTGVQYGPLGFLVARRCMDEIDALRAEIGTLRAEIAELRQGVYPCGQ